MNKKQIIGVISCILLIISCFAPLWIFIINLVPPTGIYTSKIYDVIKNGFIPRGEIIIPIILAITMVLVVIKRFRYLALIFSLASLVIIAYDLKDMIGYFRESNISSTVWSWGWYTLGAGVILLITYIVIEVRQALHKV